MPSLLFRSVFPGPLVVCLSLVAFVAAPASAFCGLQSCPRPAGHAVPPTLEVALRTRAVSYDIAGNSGHYLVTAPRVFFNRGGFAIGAEVPLTRLDNGGTVATGFSNPVAMARYARRLSHAWSAEVGLQWELPVGNRDDGLAGDHHMLLPWLGARRDFGASWYVTGMAGFSTALEYGHASPVAAPAAHTALARVAHEGHDHGEGASTPVLVNPHADREAQGRMAVGWVKGRGTLEAFALSQTDLTSAAGGTYARAGASYEWSLARFTAVQFIGDVPVTSARRNEGEFGLTVKTGF